MDKNDINYPNNKLITETDIQNLYNAFSYGYYVKMVFAKSWSFGAEKKKLELRTTQHL